MATPTYADVHELEDRLGIPLGDTREATLLEAVSAASRWIDKQTGRRFYTVTETRFYSARWHYPSDGYAGRGLYGDFPWGYPERPFGGGLASQHVAIDDFVPTAASAVGGAITGVTNVTNPVIATTTAHGLVVGQQVTIAGVVGATGANGIWTVLATPDTLHYQITAPAPGVWVSGGTTTGGTTPVLMTDDNGDGTFPTLWTQGTDYWLGPRNAVAQGKPYRSVNRNGVTGTKVFPPWENGISVAGACGFSSTVPDEIRELSMSVAMLFARPVMEMSLPGIQSYRLSGDLQVTMTPEQLTPAQRAILEDFRDPIFSI